MTMLPRLKGHGSGRQKFIMPVLIEEQQQRHAHADFGNDDGQAMKPS
jgi:hypothetical protein